MKYYSFVFVITFNHQYLYNWRLIMNKIKFDKKSRMYRKIKILVITSLALLMLVNITGCATSFSYIPNHGSNNIFNLYKSDEAIKAYDKAIETNPQNPKTWYNKGLALRKLGKLDEALKAYDRAIEINPQYSKAWYNKGLDLFDLKKFGEAIKAYEKAIEINPQYSSA